LLFFDCFQEVRGYRIDEITCCSRCSRAFGLAFTFAETRWKWPG
jgi:hypothetical protein